MNAIIAGIGSPWGVQELGYVGGDDKAIEEVRFCCSSLLDKPPCAVKRLWLGRIIVRWYWNPTEWLRNRTGDLTVLSVE